jgi:hypothetical protein
VSRLTIRELSVVNGGYRASATPFRQAAVQATPR